MTKDNKVCAASEADASCYATMGDSLLHGYGGTCPNLGEMNSLSLYSSSSSSSSSSSLFALN